jgi:peptidoglycan/xylan/chitin deacetylase (PgdA/CDA1 family)
MDSTTTHLVKTSLRALRRTRADVLLAPWLNTRGAILTMHRVSPEPPTAFSPNRILSITPEFLEATICSVLEAGYDLVAIDDVPVRLAAAENSRPFVCFTLDDGYKDNLTHAAPIFRRYGVPFTIYVPTDYPEGHGFLWWLALEDVVRRLDRITVSMNGILRTFELDDTAAKHRAYDTLYWWLRRGDEAASRALVLQWCDEAGVDAASLCRDLIMTWQEIAEIAQEPRATIGGHTRRHFAVAGLSADVALNEIRDSMRIVSERTGKPCRHFSFPYGDTNAAGPRDFALAAEAGAATAVTTQKGLLKSRHLATLTGLPRLSLNGDYQEVEYLQTLLSGVPFAMLDAARKLPFVGLRPTG